MRGSSGERRVGVVAPFPLRALRGDGLRAGLESRASNEAGGTMTSGVGVADRDEGGIKRSRPYEMLDIDTRA